MPVDDESLRDAARHLIAAGRSMLDAAEAAIDDPAMLRRLAGTFSTLAERFAATGAERSQDVDGTDEGP